MIMCIDVSINLFLIEFFELDFLLAKIDIVIAKSTRNLPVVKSLSRRSNSLYFE